MVVSVFTSVLAGPPAFGSIVVVVVVVVGVGASGISVKLGITSVVVVVITGALGISACPDSTGIGGRGGNGGKPTPLV
jgi:hypothetical protein